MTVLETSGEGLRAAIEVRARHTPPRSTPFLSQYAERAYALSFWPTAGTASDISSGTWSPTSTPSWVLASSPPPTAPKGTFPTCSPNVARPHSNDAHGRVLAFLTYLNACPACPDRIQVGRRPGGDALQQN